MKRICLETNGNNFCIYTVKDEHAPEVEGWAWSLPITKMVHVSAVALTGQNHGRPWRYAHPTPKEEEFDE
jgi:hypothetical protein